MKVLNAAARTPNGVSAIMMMSTIQTMVSSPFCVMIYVVLVVWAIIALWQDAVGIWGIGSFW